eukprot:3941399-Rhodomonas_salina.3
MDPRRTLERDTLRQYRTVHSTRIGSTGHRTSDASTDTLCQYRTSRSTRVGRYSSAPSHGFRPDPAGLL